MLTTYQQVLDYLYVNLPMFQRVGASAYKKDLANTLTLCRALGNPEKKFKSIHVAGTNGKGSTSHMLAAVLQTAGYKTGLYTSPHLKEFTERIRINGKEVDRTFIVDFVNKMKSLVEEIRPSFFELTVAMAFEYFASKHVDVAVVEVGLGGRLDSTNVITPLVSVITNISFDHQDILGHTIGEIASEKAGIIKPGVPAVISQSQPEVASVFVKRASDLQAPLSFADEIFKATITGTTLTVQGESEIDVKDFPLLGSYQEQNVPGVMRCLQILQGLGFPTKQSHIQSGLSQVTELTGLKGRWQKLGDKPLIICDTGHNIDGITKVVAQVSSTPHQRLHIVLGMVKDKDSDAILKLLPKEAAYYFCQSRIPRALAVEVLSEKAKAAGLQGRVVGDVNKAIALAKEDSGPDDLIFIGGSTFVVAEIEGL